MPLGDWRVGATYSATPVYGEGFDDHLVTLHEFNIGTRRALPLDQKTALLPALSITRVFADPDDFSTFGGDASVMVLRQFTDKLIGLVGVRAHARRYDDFFEGATGETRVDYGGGGQAMLIWRPVEWVSMTGLVEVTRNWSTLEANDYTSVEVTPTLRLNARF